MGITDQVGRHVVVAGMPGRIVSLAPSNTEILFAIGAGERVVGVTSYCDFPEAARALAKVGGFAARTISLEAVVALRPDLVVAGDRHHRVVIDALEAAGVTVVSVQPRNVSEVYAMALLLGRLTGCEAGAEQVVAGMKGRLRAIASRVEAIPADRRVRVYWEVFDQPLMTAGPRSLIGQLIELGGGVNVFGDVVEEYPQINGEAVVARDPEVILGPASMRVRSMSSEQLAARPGWGRIAAIRTGRVFVLPDELMARAGPRLVDGAELMARTLYPEQWGARDGDLQRSGTGDAR